MGAVKRWRKRWVRSFGKGTAGWLGRAALSLLSKTWRVEVLGEENLTASVKAGPGCFLSMWHGRMIVAIPTHARRGWHVLVSPSGDGDISEKLLEANGYFVIRGSSSRGGARPPAPAARAPCARCCECSMRALCSSSPPTARAVRCTR